MAYLPWPLVSRNDAGKAIGLIISSEMKVNASRAGAPTRESGLASFRFERCSARRRAFITRRTTKKAPSKNFNMAKIFRNQRRLRDYASFI